MAELAFPSGLVCLLDDADMQFVSEHKWRTCTRSTNARQYTYVVTRIARRVTLMHRLLLGVGEGVFVDHINGNGLDNRRANLRACSHAENMRNRRLNANSSSGFKGVYFRHGKWCAHIRVNWTRKHLGYFPTAELAHEAYKRAAEKYHGAFARFA